MTPHTIHIRCNENDAAEPDLKKALVRAFQVEQGMLIVLGLEHDEHDLWLLDEAQKQARLVGTLTEDAFKKIRRVRQLDLSVDGQFEHVEKAFSTARFVGRVAAFTPASRYTVPH